MKKLLSMPRVYGIDSSLVEVWCYEVRSYLVGCEADGTGFGLPVG